MLDTHTLIWLAEGDARLTVSARSPIEAAESVAVSAISFWEVAMLESRARVTLSLPVTAWRKRVLASGIEELPVDGAVAIESVALPSELHRDPPDRLLAATARLTGHHLVTHDRRLLDYAARGHLDVVGF